MMTFKEGDSVRVKKTNTITFILAKRAFGVKGKSLYLTTESIGRFVEVRGSEICICRNLLIEKRKSMIWRRKSSRANGLYKTI